MRFRKKREELFIGKKKYSIIRVLGERKNGDQYLVTDGSSRYLLEEYRLEGTKEENLERLERAEESFLLLRDLGIKIPRLQACDRKQLFLLMEYVDGIPASTLLQRGEFCPTYLEQLRRMAKKAEESGFCLDYFPTGFLCREDQLFYVQHECIPWKKELCFSEQYSKYWVAAL